jgi:ankyrin repeat protein
VRWGVHGILRRKPRRSLGKFSWQDEEEIRQLDTGNRQVTPIRFGQLFRQTAHKRAVSWLSHCLAAVSDVNAVHANSGWTLLHADSENQNLTMIEGLAKAGADLNMRNHQGWTPLHLAVDIDIDSVSQSRGDMDHLPFQTVRLLLSLGADLTVRDERGKTPRDVAAAYSNDVARQYGQYDRLTSTCC